MTHLRQHLLVSYGSDSTLILEVYDTMNVYRGPFSFWVLICVQIFFYYIILFIWVFLPLQILGELFHSWF